MHLKHFVSFTKLTCIHTRKLLEIPGIDPSSDIQFTEQERYRLNNDLLQLSQRTSGDQRADFCTTKGVDATLFITKQGNKQLAHQLNIFWAVDEQCKKSIVFVLSTNDHSLYYAADENSPISNT
uniref:Uncharacterized protein n=1 Tax=Wuchereria bancrofti TaxID=6293 RepID=A0AAF5Q7D6_WUCBA